MLKTLNIENFTCFPKAELIFSKGLNVIVGENGTGKSHLLKLGYSVLFSLYDFTKNRKKPKLFEDWPDKNSFNFKFTWVVNANFNTEKIHDLISNTVDNDAKLSVLFSNSGKFETHFQKKHCKNENLSKYAGCTDTIHFEIDDVNIKPIFFPTKEIMSVYEGFRATLSNRELGFDKTYLDFAEALDVPKFKEIKDYNMNLHANSVESIINEYIVEYDNKRFSFRKKRYDNTSVEDTKIPASLFAEGHNKLGTLSYLMRNGSIQEGMTLFWDEPEANMNPRLLKSLAKILVEMSSYMQIVLSTHSLFFLRELEILQEQKKLTNARYFGLHFNAEGTGVEVTQGDTSNDIGNIVALDEDLSQADKYLEVLNGA